MGASYERGLVPLLVGVTGHRDLVADEIPAIRQVVRSFLERLRSQFPDRPLRVLTPLAEGSDRLVADIAMALDIPIIVPLPMARETYVDDFSNEGSAAEFELFLSRAEEVYELPVAPGADAAAIRRPGPARNRQYAQLGVFLCAHSHVLLALWDGKSSNDLGGTAQVVRFRRDDVMPGYAPSEEMNQQLLAEDESDLVYHVVVSRDREDGQPAAGLKPLDCDWLTNDEASPRNPKLAEEYVEIFNRTSLFNQEARTHQAQIQAECYPLYDQAAAAFLPPAVRLINTLFCASDWLAIHYQRKMLSALRTIHGLAFIMGLMFIFYADFEAIRAFILVFFICFVIATAVHLIAARSEWHGRYLEYRALAEGLRIQFYWAAAGVSKEMATKFSHDNFLQKQDTELGWIRNVMRYAGMGSNVAPNLREDALQFVLDEWVGSEQGKGQLGYYSAKIRQYRQNDEQMTRLSKLVSVVVAGVLIASVAVSSDSVRMRLFLILGSILLFLSVRQSFLSKVAERELIKQYEFMHSIFRSAYRRIHAAEDDAERRQILRILGESALDEHAQWVFVHRDRTFDASSLLLMD
jgi:hypothetical protein